MSFIDWIDEDEAEAVGEDWDGYIVETEEEMLRRQEEEDDEYASQAIWDKALRGEG